MMMPVAHAAPITGGIVALTDLAGAMVFAGPAQRAPGGVVNMTPATVHLYAYYYRTGRPVKPRRVAGWAPWVCTSSPGLKICYTNRQGRRWRATATWTVTRHDATLEGDARVL